MSNFFSLVLIVLLWVLEILLSHNKSYVKNNTSRLTPSITLTHTFKMARSLNDSTIVDMEDPMFTSSATLLAENTALHQKIKDMECERNNMNEKFLENQKIWENRFSEMNSMLQRLKPIASTPVTSPNQQPSLSVPLMGTDDLHERISVQVEHVVRGDAFKIQPFSGNAPKHGEVSFNDWAKQIELMLEDESLSLRAKRQKLLGSLHSPALDIARGMGSISVYEMFKSLEELYAPSINGVTLLQEFFQTKMLHGEQTIEYLQRLSVMLNKVVKNGGLQPTQVDGTLLTHFKSTCLNKHVVNSIHVKFDITNPPSLLQLIKEAKRTEDDFNVFSMRDSTKTHTQKQTVESDSQFKRLQQQIDQIQQQLDSLIFPKTVVEPVISTAKTTNNVTPTPTTPKQTHMGPKRRRICLHCGKDDGHTKKFCKNPANPQLVHSLLNQTQTSQNHLNWQGPRRH